MGIPTVKGKTIDKAVRLSRLHRTDLAPILKPTAVQRGWALSIPGESDLDLVGTIDILEPGRIRDTKTASRSPQPDAIGRSIQMKTYALAVSTLDHGAPQEVTLDFLVDTKNPSVVIQTYQPDEEDSRIVMARLEILVRCLETGLFPPVEPSHWLCSPMWCGYHGSCKYVKHPRSYQVP